MADVAPPPGSVGDSTSKPRPEKPEEAKYKADLAAAEKEHATAMAKYNAAKAKIDSARPNKDSPENDRYKALIAEQNSIRAQQKENKTSRTGQLEKVKTGEAQLKSMQNELKDARARLGYKNAEEIDAKIDRLMQQVDSGAMKLVDEKKALNEVSNLRKQKKSFTGLDENQKRIDQKKEEITELKKTYDNPEARALSQKYEDNQKELDDIKAAREGTNKNFDAIKAERDKLNDDQKAAWSKIKEIKDAYYQNKKAYREYEDMIYQQRREKQKAERDAFEKEKRQRRAAQALEEASNPAYLDEIRSAESLIAHFDPASAKSDSVNEPGKFAATAQRTVEEPEMKGMKVMKKDEEDFFVGSGGKKKGKGKKATATGTGLAADVGKFNLNYGTIQALSDIGIDAPTTQAEVPGVVEKLKEKLDFWKKDQDRKTKANIDAAQKGIDRLEKEAAEASASPASKPDSRRRDGRVKKMPAKDAGVNGEASADGEPAQEEDAAAEAAEDLQKVSIEDKEKEVVVA